MNLKTGQEIMDSNCSVCNLKCRCNNGYCDLITSHIDEALKEAYKEGWNNCVRSLVRTEIK
jgi:hypothetical protein